MLIARDRELERISDAVERAHLVTLTGPGGVGKTTLAHAFADDWPHEAMLFSDLTALEDDDLAEGIAGSLWFASFSDLVDEVADRPWLLVLDNCEHLLDAAAELTEQLLEVSPQLKIVATSRERLDLPGEVVIRIDPLPTTGSPSPAAQMFLEAAHSRGLEPTDDLVDVEELCRRLDGLPLALELAAARTSAMTVAEMISHLDSRLDLLSRRRQRGPERHASLSATIAWSYQQLESDERLLFTQLSALRSPFTVGMAASVGDLDAAAALAIVDTLVERSLLVHHPIAGISTFRMLETIRAFAGEQLENRQGAEARLLDHLTTRADEMFAAGVMTQLAAPVELEYSFRNVYWAVETAIDRDDRERVFRLIAPWWWLEDVGHQSEAAELLERIIARWPEVTADTAVAWGILSLLIWDGDRCEETAAVAASSSGIGSAYGERMLGFLARRRTEWDSSLEHFARARDIAQEAGQGGLALEIQMHAGLALSRAGDLDAAVATLEEVIASSSDYAMPRAMATDFLAFTLLPYDAVRSAELSRSLLPLAADNVWLRAACNYTLGVAALIEGDIPAAASHLDSSIDAFTIIRSTTDIVLVYLCAATLFVRLGDHETARAIIGGHRATYPAKLGAAEQGLLERLGPLPVIEGDVPPMPADEVRRRLQQIATGSAIDPATSAVATGNRFLRSGDVWTISYDGVETRLRDSKGLADLATLLSRPGVEVAALDLMDAGVVSGDAGPSSDAAARKQYESRIRSLQDDIDEAEAAGDSYRAERAREELDALVDHLTAAYGLGGKERASGQPAEKARSAVTWRIRSSIKKITAAHPALGDHLDRSVKTGRFCAYEPTERVIWET
ncbi:MAG: hypothetical protein QNJ77_14380 [Acidimicrobiia bacterium]|nr:hypothetical protein [Acidimicrobiia bacterium]